VTRVILVDYGASNVKSIVRGLERAGATVEVATTPEAMAGADGLVLPGVGAAGSAMRGLHERGLTAPLSAALRAGTPFLGVCLGMQLLFGRQEEDDAVGLGLLPGQGRRLHGVKVPHMGWNTIDIVAGNAGPLAGLPADAYAYFVHSYYAEIPDADAALVAGTSFYGKTIVTAVARENLWGVQFHPEKSGAVGAHILRTFVERCTVHSMTSSAPAGALS